MLEAIREKMPTGFQWRWKLNKTALRIINMRKLDAALAEKGFNMGDSVLDPLSRFNEVNKRVDYHNKVLNVKWKGNSLAVPLDYYWQTDDADWIAESMAVEFALGFNKGLATQYELAMDVTKMYPSMSLYGKTVLAAPQQVQQLTGLNKAHIV